MTTIALEPDKARVMDPSVYHRILEALWKKGMEDEWILIYVLGQTGILVSELCELRPSDLSSEGPIKTIALYPVRGRKSMKISHKISGQTAGVLERWIVAHGIGRDEKIFSYTKRTAQNMFRRALLAIGVKERYTTRSLRHMYGLTVAMATEDRWAVAKALRKRDLPSAKLYVSMAKKMMTEV